MTQRCVLIVDDEYRLREVICMTLEIMTSWKILGADSGQAGIEMARSHSPDAIVLDLMMPEMDGVTTFQKLQADAATAHIPVVLLTAQDGANYQADVVNIPFAAHIAKPFDTVHLAEEIAGHLGWEL
ncbi:MAG: response regulator [Spirulinaceae cyanobacterium SM2_1_0]|nr:response regulator [Spirulinaceae cyanobacterium SM2_1_0]